MRGKGVYMFFVEGELESIFQFLMFLPLLFKIPVYASAFSRLKSNSTIGFHKIYLVLTNLCIIVSFVNLLTKLPVFLYLLLLLLTSIAPLVILNLTKRYLSNKNISAHFIYMGFLQLLFWLSCYYIFIWIRIDNSYDIEVRKQLTRMCHQKCTLTER